MSAVESAREWRACVCIESFPNLHKHQAKALADLSFAFLAAGSCQSGPAAASMPGRATAASVQRRIERTVANPRLKPTRVVRGIARFAADRLARSPPILILDETFNGLGMACMRVSIAYRRRALPIAADRFMPLGVDLYPT